jgi:hypothetical protein
MTPQLRALAGRHARYFDNTLAVHGGPSDPLRDASFSARETPRCGAHFLPGEVATECRLTLLQHLPVPGENQGGAPTHASRRPNGPIIFLFLASPTKTKSNIQAEGDSPSLINPTNNNSPNTKSMRRKKAIERNAAVKYDGFVAKQKPIGCADDGLLPRGYGQLARVRCRPYVPERLKPWALVGSGGHPAARV